MIDLLVVSLGAYVAVLVQVGVLGAWPLLGGQPNLIALGSVVFLLLQRPILGLWWILIGGSLIDLLLPVRFGSTALLLVLAYIGLAVAIRRVAETLPWWMGVVFSLLLLTASELPLVVYTRDWHQLLLDGGAALILMVPVCTIVVAAGMSNRPGHHVTL